MSKDDYGTHCPLCQREWTETMLIRNTVKHCTNCKMKASEITEVVKASKEKSESIKKPNLDQLSESVNKLWYDDSDDDWGILLKEIRSNLIKAGTSRLILPDEYSLDAGAINYDPDKMPKL